MEQRDLEAEEMLDRQREAQGLDPEDFAERTATVTLTRAEQSESGETRIIAAGTVRQGLAPVDGAQVARCHRAVAEARTRFKEASVRAEAAVREASEASLALQTAKRALVLAEQGQAPFGVRGE